MFKILINKLEVLIITFVIKNADRSTFSSIFSKHFSIVNYFYSSPNWHL